VNHPGQFSARTTSCLLSIFNTQQQIDCYLHANAVFAAVFVLNPEKRQISKRIE
jgi:hypothetical protein